MEYNGVLRKEMRQKSPSPNAVIGGEKEMREIKEMEEEEEEELCSNFKPDEAAVFNYDI